MRYPVYRATTIYHKTRGKMYVHLSSLTLDGHGEEVDVLEGLDLVLLHQAAKLGDRHPLLVVVARATATASASASTVTTAPSEAAAA